MHAHKYDEPVTALGLMSGTSMDGVDIALIETDGTTVQQFGAVGERRFTAQERTLLRGALEDARTLRNRGSRPGGLGQAEAMITDAYAEAIENFLARHNLPPAGVAVAGVHGQTVLHRPQQQLTVQLIDADALARRCGLTVIHDLRGADISAGGQGAPLVPAYHQALVAAAGLDLPVAVLNIGGVANVTWVGPDSTLIAFDTGPGNAMLDDWVWRHTGELMDRDGKMARAGTVDTDALSALESQFSAYLSQQPPKSLDRLDFANAAAAMPPLRAEDGAATLVAFTARTLALSVAHMPAQPKTWIVTGGGARNPAIMDALKTTLPGDLRGADELGWQSTFIEAQAFAFLAVRSLRGLPLTFPGTTGAPRPLCGGLQARPDRAA